MIGNRKIIGACISELHNVTKSEQMELLNKELLKYGYKLIIFNSILNVYDNSAYDEGASSIFNLINFDILDCLIIFDRGFSNKQAGTNLISRAKEKNVPVIVVNAEIEGCYCIVDDFKTSYRNLIRHVIRDHNVKDTYFMGGFRWNPETLDRLACYRKALGDENLSYDESMVGYGEFWDDPAVEQLNSLLEERGTPPQAIFCANDCMAMAVIRRLNELGYRVPEDVIVTGYDGIEEGKYFIPNLTTIKENAEGEAIECARLVFDIIEKKAEIKTIRVPYKVVYNESCGCPSGEDFSDYRVRMAESMRRNREFSGHETAVYEGVDKFLACESLSEMLEKLVEYDLEGRSYLYIRSMLLESLDVMYGNLLKLDYSKEYVAISSESEEEFGVVNDIDFSVLIPGVEEWLEDNTVCIANALYVENYQFGIFLCMTDDVGRMSSRINRVSRALNLSFGIVYNRVIQKGMEMELEQSVYTDSATGLSNIKGLEKWFDDYSNESKNHNTGLMITIYKLDKYTYLYENYGVDEIESIMNKVTEFLRKCNGNRKLIAKKSEDEFVIVDYSGEFDEAANRKQSMYKRVNKTLSSIENYNAMHIKDYDIVLNYGTTYCEPGWNTNIRILMKQAYGELYLNILQNERRLRQDDIAEDDTKDYYEELKLILSKNLLTYHFQPIIDMQSGEIYAYEALMRTTGDINISPLVLLKTAAKYNKLYDLEKMTLFGIMDYYVSNFERFKGRRVFINSIPGHFLNDVDFDEFVRKYKEYLKYCVFEITEQDSISDKELTKIKTLTVDEMKAQLAVDDYGSGQSNIQNLLRYAPNIVKIDRFLIEDICNDTNKQLFISNIIEFARLNNIRVVGEGVENQEEFRAISEYGVDYIQGFYAARPKAEPLGDIPEEIKKLVENLRK